MNNMNPKVDFYLSKAKKWQKELAKMSLILLDCGLTEELKWALRITLKFQWIRPLPY